jgi:tetraacyldisaccharide 4'-kinase
MRPPAFWSAPGPTLAARALSPLAAIYGAAAARRMARPGERAPVPVVCVGNFTLGGAGKTPTALLVAEILRAAGHRPAFLSRGYGGSEAGPLRVDPDRGRPEEVGDEPLLLARSGPTYVSRDRPAGAQLAAAEGASAIVMDDGLQNPSLVKDLSLAVVDGGSGVGNGMVFPAGPLRAPLAAQWPRIGGLVAIGPGEPGERLAREAAARGLPVFRAALEPEPAAAAGLRGRPVLAFAGIGRPGKFFDTLEALGAVVAERRAFPDHHAFTPEDLNDLRRCAAARGLALVTTEKDRVRLPPGFPAQALPVRLRVEEAGFVTLILGSLTGN